MPFKIKTAATVYPVTRDEAKKHAIIEHSLDDEYVDQLIKIATLYGQNWTGRMFVETTFELHMEEFESGAQEIRLKPNLQSVESITYTDSEGVGQAIGASNYKVDDVSLVGSVKPISTYTWPSDAEDIVIEFKAGWPLAGDPLVPTTPEDIKGWIMCRVAGMYEQRENFVLSKSGQFGVAAMPKDFIDDILNFYSIPVA